MTAETPPPLLVISCGCIWDAETRIRIRACPAHNR